MSTYTHNIWLVSQRSWDPLRSFSHRWLVVFLVIRGLFAWGFICTQLQKTGWNGWNILSHCLVDMSSKLCFVNDVKFRSRWSCCSSRTIHAFCRTSHGEFQTHTSHIIITNALNLYRTFSIHGTRSWGAKLVQSWCKAETCASFDMLWHALTLSLVPGAIEGQSWLSATLARWECSILSFLDQRYLSGPSVLHQALHLHGDLNNLAQACL